MKRKRSIWMSFLLLSLITISCQKQQVDNELTSSSGDMSVDIALLDEYNADLYDVLDDADLFLAGDLKNGSTDCRTVTFEPEAREEWPKTITIDFGEGCEVREGVIKKGKIIIRQSAPRNADTWRKMVTYDGYQVNDDAFNGKHTVGFTNTLRVPTWNTSDELTITRGDGTEISRNSQHLRQQLAGFDTPRLKEDDVFRLSGESSGVNRKGQAYSEIITEPLIIPVNCRWITKGIKEITLGEEPVVILDYGDGSCDNQATVTKDGETKTITLRGMRR